MGHNPPDKRNKSGRILFEKLDIDEAQAKALKNSKRYKRDSNLVRGKY